MKLNQVTLMKKLCLLTEAGSHFWPLENGMGKTSLIQGAGNLGCSTTAAILHPMEMFLGSFQGTNCLAFSVVAIQ